ncbi:MAG: 2-oxoacid:acceptor oxidoreductase family protein [Halobacteriota archaeon]|nr:2-oxoacid:acceptor oxidoreductase family protein [Halobacteriota archaeon]
MSTFDIRLAGSGGQGLVFASIVLARAASIYETKSVSMRDSKLEKKRDDVLFAAQTQTCDAAVRGGDSRAEVKISDEEILFPQIGIPDILILTSESAFDKYGYDVKKETITILDPGTVRSRPKNKFFEIPATAIASSLGRALVANVVMLGAISAITGVVSLESVKKALLDQIPKGTEDLNLKALNEGYELGEKVVENRSHR